MFSEFNNRSQLPPTYHYKCYTLGLFTYSLSILQLLKERNCKTSINWKVYEWIAKKKRYLLIVALFQPSPTKCRVGIKYFRRFVFRSCGICNSILSSNWKCVFLTLGQVSIVYGVSQLPKSNIVFVP